MRTYKIGTSINNTNTILPNLFDHVILKAGTLVSLYSRDILNYQIECDIDTEYSVHELELKPYGPNQDYYVYRFKKPYPLYDGTPIESIAWFT